LEQQSLRNAAGDELMAEIARNLQAVAAPGDGPVINQPAALMAAAASPANSIAAALGVSPIPPGDMGDISEEAINALIARLAPMPTPDAVPMSDEPVGAARGATEAGLTDGEGRVVRRRFSNASDWL